MEEVSHEAAVAEEDTTTSKGRARKETLAIPQDVRQAVDARDQMHCRVCGKYVGEERALHHVIFGGDARGMGGRRVHDPDEIITVCWMWGGNCHDRVHTEKRRWQQILLDVAQRPGVTAFQLERWRRNNIRRAR